MQASKGIKNSGISSSPVNLLLLVSPSRSFTKLEMRSPIIAPDAATKPTFHPRPISSATIVVSANGENNPPYGLGRAEERITVGEDCVAIERQNVILSQELCGDHRSTIGDSEKHEKLG